MCVCVSWINLAQDRNQRLTLINTVLELWFKDGGTVNFSVFWVVTKRKVI